MKALYLNCTLKKGPSRSHTHGLMSESSKILEAEGFDTEILRVVDYDIAHSVDPKQKDEDDWKQLYDKVMEAKIVVIGTPIWLGEKSSVAVKLMERLYAHSAETNDAGQYLYYNKVGGIIATGNEDGGKQVSRSILYGLQHLGFTVPPQVDAYWVGEAGPGPSYLDAGKDNGFTKRNIRILSWNLIHFARMLAKNPIPAEGNIVEEK